jgi:hypothetical protein
MHLQPMHLQPRVSLNLARADVQAERKKQGRFPDDSMNVLAHADLTEPILLGLGDLPLHDVANRR